MKKLFLLTTSVLLTAACGCNQCHWACKGAPCSDCDSVVMGGDGYVSDPFVQGPALAPSDGYIAPAPNTYPLPAPQGVVTPGPG